MKHTLPFLLFFVFIGGGCQQSPDDCRKQAVLKLVALVADWQVNNLQYAESGSSGYLHDYGIDAWPNATFYYALSELTNSDLPLVYDDWLLETGAKSKWRIAENFKDYPRYLYYHADELCIGQFYLNMYDKYKEEIMLACVSERVHWIINNPPNELMNYRNKQLWSWCDALFMAPPVYAHLYNILKEEEIIRFMDDHYKRTYTHLYDRKYKLFYRDDSFFDKPEQNGEPVFWGRGNGWVAAGLVNLLKLLPADSPYRSFYVELFKEFVPRLAEFQSADGFWCASLLDPDSYPSPETSSTALIAYAIAYGINQKLLPEKQFLPVVNKAWEALCSTISEEGKMGWVQPIGADPKKVTENMTAVYGPAAFILAGIEIYALY